MTICLQSYELVRKQSRLRREITQN